MQYEFEQTRRGSDTWQEAMRWTRPFASDRQADEYAQACANEDEKETRWNSEGSGQGHYCRPQKKKLTIIERIDRRIKTLERDERIQQKPALVEINAPLALMQCEITGRLLELRALRKELQNV